MSQDLNDLVSTCQQTGNDFSMLDVQEPDHQLVAQLSKTHFSLSAIHRALQQPQCAYARVLYSFCQPVHLYSPSKLLLFSEAAYLISLAKPSRRDDINASFSVLLQKSSSAAQAEPPGLPH